MSKPVPETILVAIGAALRAGATIELSWDEKTQAFVALTLRSARNGDLQQISTRVSSKLSDVIFSASDDTRAAFTADKYAAAARGFILQESK